MVVMPTENFGRQTCAACLYKFLEILVVPTTFKVLRRLKKGDFSYANFNSKKVECNEPERFRASNILDNITVIDS